MEYTLKAGSLYLQDRILARIRSTFSGPDKEIVSPDGVVLLRTEIQTSFDPRLAPDDVRRRCYRLLDADGREIALARPDYAAGNMPEIMGWSVCQTPQVDRAQVQLDQPYILLMQNSQNYQLQRPSGAALVRIMHRGLTGGWNIETDQDFSPAELCGIFMFCRYLEEENEFLII